MCFQSVFYAGVCKFCAWMCSAFSIARGDISMHLLPVALKLQQVHVYIYGSHTYISMVYLVCLALDPGKSAVHGVALLVVSLLVYFTWEDTR